MRLLPLVSPLLLLIVGTVVAEARAPRPDATVEGFAYRVSLGMSVFYLTLTALTILLCRGCRRPTARPARQ